MADDARFRTDGSCGLVDTFEGAETSWPTVRAWAAAWFAEGRAKEYGPAHEFGEDVCSRAVPGVVNALITLAEAAGGDGELLGVVGAGPLESLVSHSGRGLEVLPDVDRAARQNPAFRAALRSVWLGPDVPEPVRSRLAELGATILEPRSRPLPQKKPKAAIPRRSDRPGPRPSPGVRRIPGDGRPS